MIDIQINNNDLLSSNTNDSNISILNNSSNEQETFKEIASSICSEGNQNLENSNIHPDNINRNEIAELDCEQNLLTELKEDNVADYDLAGNDRAQQSDRNLLIEEMNIENIRLVDKELNDFSKVTIDKLDDVDDNNSDNAILKQIYHLEENEQSQVITTINTEQNNKFANNIGNNNTLNPKNYQNIVSNDIDITSDTEISETENFGLKSNNLDNEYTRLNSSNGDIIDQLFLSKKNIEIDLQSNPELNNLPNNLSNSLLINGNKTSPGSFVENNNSVESHKINSSIDITVMGDKWSKALGDRLIMMVNGSSQKATIRLDPPSLGSIDIQIKMNGQEAAIVFNTENVNVKELIESSIDRLRSQLGEQGFNLVDVDVNHQENLEKNFYQEISSNKNNNKNSITEGENESESEVMRLSNRLIDRYV